MPPKRLATTTKKKKRHEEEEDEEDDDDVVVLSEEESEDDFDEEDSEEEEDEAPKKKKKAPAKKPAAGSRKKEPAAAAKKSPAKRKAKVEKVDIKDIVAAEGGEDAPVASPKPKKQKAVAVTEPTVLEDGFTAHPPSLLYKAFGEQSESTKIAAFDLDGTLVQTKSGSTFPLGGHDWVFYNDQVVPKLQQYHKDGYRIAIFTNQGGIKSALTGAASSNFRERVTSMLQHAGVPAVVLAATQKDDVRKPERGMWDFFCEHFMGGQQPDLSESFFVGDNIDEGDAGFAASIGLTFRSEREEFGEREDVKTASRGPGGGSGLPQGPVEVQGTGQGPNAELINIFQTLAEVTKAGGGDKAHFKVAALKKVAGILQEYPHKITQDRLKEVSNIKGVGKGSLDKIKEYLATGTVAELHQDGGGGASAQEQSKRPTPAGKEGKQMESKARAEALQFM